MKTLNCLGEEIEVKMTLKDILLETLIDERIAAALDEYSQTAPESAILAAGLIAEQQDEETTAAD